MADPSSFTGALALVDGVEGWLTDDQARRLWERAGALVPGERLVEIGSFRGRSTIVMAAAAPAGVEVVAIDPHAGNDRGPDEIRGFTAQAEGDHEVFHRNLDTAGVGTRVRHVRLPSERAVVDVDGSIDLLYIDGAHRFGPARSDIVRWGARVRPGGSLLIHDSFSAIGVTLALAASLFFSRRFRYLGRVTSLAEYRCEPHPLSPTERVRNAARQFAQLPWFVRCQVLKWLIRAGREDWARRLGHTTGPWPH